MCRYETRRKLETIKTKQQFLHAKFINYLKQALLNILHYIHYINFIYTHIFCLNRRISMIKRMVLILIKLRYFYK